MACAHVSKSRLASVPMDGGAKRYKPLEPVAAEEEFQEEIQEEQNIVVYHKPFLCCALKRRRKRLRRSGGCGCWPGLNIGDFEEFGRIHAQQTWWDTFLRGGA